MHKLLKLLINSILITNSLISLSNSNNKRHNNISLKNNNLVNDSLYEILNTNIKNYFQHSIIQIYNLDDAKAKITVAIENILTETFTDTDEFNITSLELIKDINIFNKWTLFLNISKSDELFLSTKFEVKLQYLINWENYFHGKKVYFEQFHHQKSNTERILLVREINNIYKVDVLTFDYKVKNAISHSTYLGFFEKNSPTGSFALSYNSNYIRLFHYYNEFLQIININNDLSINNDNYNNFLSNETINVNDYYNDQSQIHINFTDKGYHAYVSDVSEKYHKINSKYIYGAFFHAPLTSGNDYIDLPNLEPLNNKYLLFSENNILLIGLNSNNENMGYIFNYINEEKIIKLNLEILKNKNIFEIINWDYNTNTLSYISKINNKLYLEVIDLNNNDILINTAILDNNLIHRNSSNTIVAEIQIKDDSNNIWNAILKKNNSLLLINFTNENLITRNLCDYAFYIE